VEVNEAGGGTGGEGQTGGMELKTCNFGMGVESRGCGGGREKTNATA